MEFIFSGLILSFGFTLSNLLMVKSKVFIFDWAERSFHESWAIMTFAIMLALLHK